jgi:uncharacterized membrane-anchored protein
MMETSYKESDCKEIDGMNTETSQIQDAIAIPVSPPRQPGGAKRAALLGLIVTAQMGALFAFAFPYAQTLAFGKTVTLQCHSYDPRDMFKGDYVAITYDVGNKVSVKDFKAGETAYLTLKKDGDYWRATKASKTLPKSLADNEAVMRATVNNGAISPPSITTGIEKFYVPEGTGNNVNFENLTAEVSLAKDGMPVLKRLLSEGKTVGINEK